MKKQMQRSRERVKEEEELGRITLQELNTVDESNASMIWNEYAIPEEIIRLIILQGGAKVFGKLLSINTAGQKLEMMWYEFYRIRFGDPPQWFTEEFEKRSNMQRITAIKNLYSWTNEVVSKYLRIDDIIAYSMPMMVAKGENHQPYTVKLLYNRERPKATVMAVDKEGNQTLAENGIRFEEDPERIILQFHIKHQILENEVETNFEMLHVSATFNTTTQDITWNITPSTAEFSFQKKMAEFEGLPKFMEKMKDELKLKWNPNTKTLLVETYPHFKTMFMNHYFSQVDVLDYFKKAHGKWVKKPDEFKSHFPLGGKLEDDFVSFCYSLLITDPSDFIFLALQGYIGISEESQRDFLRQVTIPVIFDGTSLPLSFNLPMSCSLCAEVANIQCHLCEKANYCSEKCRDFDFKVHRHDKICVSNKK